MAIRPFPAIEHTRAEFLVSDGGLADLDGQVNGACEIPLQVCVLSGEPYGDGRCTEAPIERFSVNARWGPDLATKSQVEASVLYGFLTKPGAELIRRTAVGFSPPLDRGACTYAFFRLPTNGDRSSHRKLQVLLNVRHPGGVEVRRFVTRCLSPFEIGAAGFECVSRGEPCIAADPQPFPLPSSTTTTTPTTTSTTSTLRFGTTTTVRATTTSSTTRPATSTTTTTRLPTTSTTARTSSTSTTTTRTSSTTTTLLRSDNPTLFVSTRGNDANSGRSESTAVRTLARALDLAVPGDVIRVKAGLYRGRVEVPRSGRPGAPITIACEAGARLDGGELHDSGWVRAPEVDPAGRVWKKVVRFPGDAPEHMVRGAPPNDHYILKVSDNRDGPDRMAGCTGPGGDWATCPAGKILRDGPLTRPTSCCSGAADHSWDGVEGFFAVDVATSTVYVRFADGSSPNGQPVTLAPRYPGVLTLRSRSWIVVRGCQIAGANYGIVADQTSDLVLEGNTFRHGRANLYLLGGNHHEIRNNRFTLGYRYPLTAGTPLQWRIWTAMRANSDMTRVAVLQQNPGSNHRIHHNTFTQVFVGIADRGCNQMVGFGNDTHIYANDFQSGLNDAMNLQCPAVRREVFDNSITNFNAAFRLGTYAGGELHVYRNRIFSATTSMHEGACFFLYREAGGTQNIYHNTCSTNQALVLGSTDENPDDGSENTRGRIGWPRTRFVSNIFSSATFFNQYHDWSAVFAAGAPPPRVEFNWIGGNPPGWVASTNTVRPGVRLWPATQLPAGPLGGAEPQAGARAVGWDVTAARTGLATPYPGFAGRYYPDARPDPGAVQR